MTYHCQTRLRMFLLTSLEDKLLTIKPFLFAYFNEYLQHNKEMIDLVREKYIHRKRVFCIRNWAMRLTSAEVNTKKLQRCCWEGHCFYLVKKVC